LFLATAWNCRQIGSKWFRCLLSRIRSWVVTGLHPYFDGLQKHSRRGSLLETRDFNTHLDVLSSTLQDSKWRLDD
jgi:hypothetical protein